MTQPPKKILLPMDDSDYSINTFEWFIKFLYKERDHVFLVYCEDPDEKASHPITASALEKQDILGLGSANHTLDAAVTSGQIMEIKMKNIISQNSFKGEACIVKGKKPGEVIVQFANEHKIDVIVIASQGTGYNTRTTVGRTCDYVMEHAYIPTIVCRAIPAPPLTSG